MPIKPIEERIWGHILKTDECWLWKGATSRGYGYVSVSGKKRPAHRVVYELLEGEIPGDLQLDHLCRVRNCVNPSHLEPVTCQENVRRGNAPTALNALKMTCPVGHPYSEENTYTCRAKRYCRTCIAAAKRLHAGKV